MISNLHFSRNDWDDFSLNCESGRDEVLLQKIRINSLLQFCLKNKVDVVANQKVFEAEFVEEFLKHGILVLPRLGYKGCEMLKSICKCDLVLTSLEQLPAIDPTTLIRQIDYVGVVHLNNQSYIHLNKENCNALTLVMQSWCENSCEELKVSTAPFLLFYYIYVKRRTLDKADVLRWPIFYQKIMKHELLRLTIPDGQLCQYQQKQVF